VTAKRAFDTTRAVIDSPRHDSSVTAQHFGDLSGWGLGPATS